MNIHEYQAKQFLASHGVVIPAGELATKPYQAAAAAERIGGNAWVVKAQVHAGGRGKAGGIRVCRSHDEVYAAAASLLGSRLVTPQTGQDGRLVRKILVEEMLDIEREIYTSLLADRETLRIVLLASSEGGKEIEEVASRSPEQIHKEYIDFWIGIQPFHIRILCDKLGLNHEVGKQARAFFQGFYKAFVAREASLIEVNPLAITRDGAVVALDAKVNFDDNAVYWYPDVQALRDKEEEDPLEVRASEHHLSYIKLHGDIGNLVNGAGLAMATMDIIKHYGGEPANFLDIGGSADREMVKAAFDIIYSDNVRAILVNIFGGIMRCDDIADGIVAAARQATHPVPLVVRLKGTNMERGYQIIRDSGLPIVMAETMAEAAQKVVAASQREG